MAVLIVVGGGVVRVTGSGLGCPEWPVCTGSSIAPTPAMGIHGIIEFANRLLTVVLCAAVGWLIVAARLQQVRQRNITRWGWIQFWVVALNAVVGGITVWVGLSPYVVAAHFIAATLLLTAAVITWFKADSLDRPRAGASVPSGPRTLAAALVTVTALLIVVGTVVTGTGPHAGDSAEVHRIPINWTMITIVHGALAAAVFVIALAMRRSLRSGPHPRATARVNLFLAVLAAQGIIGIVQSLTSLPSLMVILHLFGAALVWVGAVRVLLECRGPSPARESSGRSASAAVLSA